MSSYSKKILFVDDSPSMRLFVELSLSSKFEIDTACDGEDAIHKMEGKEYDLFFVDIYMPKIDGISLIKKIRSNSLNKFKPIIVISTEADDDLLRRGRDAGATGWLVKPFDEDSLMKTICHLLKI